MLRDPAARRYARAVFELAVERDELDAWLRDLGGLAEAFSTPEAQAFLTTRQVSPQAKEAALRPLGGEITPLVWNLVRLLNGKGRLALLPQVWEHFQELSDEHRGIAHARVVTAVPMNEDERSALERRLSEMTGRQVEIEAEEDPEILGGLVARIGDRLIDGSTKSKLVALKRRLAGATR